MAQTVLFATKTGTLDIEFPDNYSRNDIKTNIIMMWDKLLDMGVIGELSLPQKPRILWNIGSSWTPFS